MRLSGVTFNGLTRINFPVIINNRMIYDSIPNTQTMGGNTNLLNMSILFGRGLIDTANISKVRFKAETNDGIVQDGLRFNDLGSLEAWRLADIANYGARLTVYDEIDETIPVFNKINGSNRLYAALSGRNRYVSHDYSYLIDSENKFRAHDSVLSQTWNICHPDAIEQYKSTLMWSNKKRTNRYRLPITNGLIQGSGQREYFDVNTQTIETDNNGNFWILGSPIYISVRQTDLINNPDTMNIETFVSNAQRTRRLVKSYYSERDVSVIVAYPMRLQGDNNKRGVFIKPLGMDYFYLNAYDHTKYDLEVVYNDFGHQNNLFRTIYGNGGVAFSSSRYDFGSDNTGVPREDILLHRTKLRQRGSAFGQPHPAMKFRLRDKITGKIGNLSGPMIVNMVGGSNNPSQFGII